MEETGRLFHASANGDTWLIVDNGLTNTSTIKHQPNVSVGGKPTRMSLQNFLSERYGPQHDALIEMIRR
jgi:N-formylglutamate amidohydrolase